MRLSAIHTASTLLCGVVALLLHGFIATAKAQAARTAVQIAPHRAVYDITLLRASTGSGISQMSGRMVYELKGSTCEGYSQEMRFVTRITDRNGNAQINDLRSSSWEGGMARRLRFDLRQFRNQHLTDATQGQAGRISDAEGGIDVQLEKPRRADFKLDGDVLFPMQHTIALITAAKAGRRVVTANVFDGSESGKMVYLTSAFIGKKFPKGTNLVPKSVNARLAAEAPPTWPVSISFFEPGGGRTDAVPAYELSFRFTESGISTRLLIDYGEFAVRGKLRKLSLLERTECEKPPRAAQ